MKYWIAILLMTFGVTHTVINAQDFAAARKMCENYGFVPNTPPFAQCVQTEVNKSKDNVSDEKQNQACLLKRQQIKNWVFECSSSCSINNPRNYRANMTCTEKCEQSLNLIPICKD
jgi:hypothetical protein